jgi:antitoxin ParD1/3/4
MYGSASEVIREALRLFEAYHSVRLEDRAALKVGVDAGVQDFKDGRVSQIDVNALTMRA